MCNPEKQTSAYFGCTIHEIYYLELEELINEEFKDSEERKIVIGSDLYVVI